jgi:hypothetical protein
MMIMLCQWDFSEQIEKLARMYLCTSDKSSRNSRSGYISYPVSKRRVKQKPCSEVNGRSGNQEILHESNRKVQKRPLDKIPL